METHLADSVTAAVGQLNASQDGDVLLVVSDGRDSEDVPMQPAAAAAKARKACRSIPSAWAAIWRHPGGG